jgi:penicillin amidase
VFTEEVEVCRTVHGPVVAYSEDGTRARSVQYAMYRRELETVNGILQWNRADDLAQFEQGMRQVTWNENTVYADADGHIAYWHPGLFPKRSPGWDSRFPAPGTGEHDHRGVVPFEQMPQVVDPDVGYVANWNNKPATGWIDEFLEPASSRSAGKAARIQVIHELLAKQPRLTPEALRATEYRPGQPRPAGPGVQGAAHRRLCSHAHADGGSGPAARLGRHDLRATGGHL